MRDVGIYHKGTSCFLNRFTLKKTKSYRVWRCKIFLLLKLDIRCYNIFMGQSKKIEKMPMGKTRHPLPMRKPPRMEGKQQNRGIKPVRKSPKNKK